jgi:hypothetical protein
MHVTTPAVATTKPGDTSTARLIQPAIFLSVFAVYLLSTPRTVVLEDDGLFVLAAYFNGIAHSPGYPLFTFLGHLATCLPIGSVAFRVHALSAFFGAAAVMVLYRVALMLFDNRVFAVAAAFCLGVSKTFWSQAIIAEVYTLNAFIYLIMLWGAIQYTKSAVVPSHRFLYAMFFVYGLGLSNHWPLIILSTPSLLAVLWPRIKTVLRSLLPGFACLALGLSPYVWMVVRSQMDPMISFYGPLNSWDDIWFMISRQGYAGADHQAGATHLDKLLFCVYALKESAIQFGPLGGILASIGFIRQWIRWRINVCIGLLLGYLGSTMLLAGLLNFNFMPLYQYIFKVYPLIAYSILAIWTALGLHEATLYLKTQCRISITQPAVDFIFTAFIIMMGLVSNLPYNYRVHDRLGENYALTVLATLEKDAIFFTFGDLDTGTLGYYNLVEKVRPDVTLYNVRGLVFSNRLENPIYYDPGSSHKTLSDFIASQQRPIYFVSSLPEIYGVRDYGLYLRLDKSLGKGRNMIMENARIKAFAENLQSLEKLYDTWESMFHKSIISDYCRIATHLYFFDDPVKRRKELFKVCRGYYGLTTAANVLLTKAEPDMEFIASLLDRAELLRNEAKNREDFARYTFIKAMMLEKQGELESALKYYKKGTEEWPDEKNPAYEQLKRLREKMGGIDK